MLVRCSFGFYGESRGVGKEGEFSGSNLGEKNKVQVTLSSCKGQIILAVFVHENNIKTPLLTYLFVRFLSTFWMPSACFSYYIPRYISSHFLLSLLFSCPLNVRNLTLFCSVVRIFCQYINILVHVKFVPKAMYYPIINISGVVFGRR